MRTKPIFAILFVSSALCSLSYAEPLRVDVPVGDTLALLQTVESARAGLDDAKAYLAELERGHFDDIFIVDGSTLRCGAASNPACVPLTEADKAQALAEAREIVVNTTAELADAEAAYQEAGSFQTASYSAGPKS